MRTLIGYEAIDVAEEYGIPLFDRHQNKDITAEQAKKLIDGQRDPDTFALEDWPETDKESELVVLHRLHIAATEHNMPEASIADICRLEIVGRGVHTHAAGAAAERLVAQHKLETIEGRAGERLYRIPKNTYFKQSFLESLRAHVCDECAHLNLEKPFHKTCLVALVDYLINEEFTLSDVTIIGESNGATGSKIPNLLHGASARWLSHTVTATTGRLRSVVKPILTQNRTDEQVGHASSARGSALPPLETPAVEPNPVINAAELRTRDKISKEELIRYLRNVEIVDEDGELAALKAERDRLLKQVDAQKHEIQQIERQRMLLQGHCEDMQRDMDTLLQAMQIAKRRGYNPSHVIDADVQGSDSN